MAKIPSTERTHKISNIEATACKGRGKMPIAQPIAMSIRTSHKVTAWLLIVKRTKFGIEIPDIGTYPKNQRMTKTITIPINIIYCVSISFGVIG